MNISELANPHILKQPVYKPGKPIEQVAEEHGLLPESVCKLASNENPLGPSPKAIEAAKVAMGQVRLYPEGGGRRRQTRETDRNPINPLRAHYLAEQLCEN